MIERLSQVAGRPVSRETFEKLEAFAALLREESGRQNLVAQSTLADLWERHILDSAQLLRFEPSPGARWLDIGSGAGLPGIVIACLAQGPMTMVEPRRLRAEFLHKAVLSLQLDAKVECVKVERLRGQFDIITARAVAALPRLLDLSHHLSTTNTVWALPKGRKALAELADARHAWHGAFHVERSVTDENSLIVVAAGVRAKRA